MCLIICNIISQRRRNIHYQKRFFVYHLKIEIEIHTLRLLKRFEIDKLM